MADKQPSNIQPLQTVTKTDKQGELALRCAEFFMTLSETCYQFYHTYKAEKERKTKQIAKLKKNKMRIKPRGDDNNDDKSQEQIKKKLPKKPLTAYIIYFQEKKPVFVEKHPDLNLSELTKLIAKQWKEISDGDRKPYLDQAQQDRKRYDEELKEFKSKYGANIISMGQSERQIQNINQDLQVEISIKMKPSNQDVSANKMEEQPKQPKGEQQNHDLKENCQENDMQKQDE